MDPEYTSILRDFYERHTFVTLVVDVMFVNGIVFLVTLSQDLRLFTCEYVPTCPAKQISTSLTKIVQLYAHGGFIFCIVLMDTKFEKKKDKMELVYISATAV